MLTLLEASLDHLWIATYALLTDSVIYFNNIIFKL